MELDLRELNGYEQHIADAKEQLADAKRNLDYYRLQAKQTRAMIQVAKKHKTLKAFIKAMPTDGVEVTPAPGLIYASITLGCMAASLYRDVPEKLGLIIMESKQTQPESIASPVLRIYKCDEGRVRFYITTLINR